MRPRKWVLGLTSGWPFPPHPSQSAVSIRLVDSGHTLWCGRQRPDGVTRGSRAWSSVHLLVQGQGGLLPAQGQAARRLADSGSEKGL